MLLPFWDPQIPPLGIACLKRFISSHDFPVKTADANVEENLRECRDRYYRVLKESVPANKRRHLYNIGHEVLKNHMMAHLHYKNENDYRELVKIVVFKTFFTPLDDPQVNRLIETIDDFYRHLEKYILELLDKEKPAVLGISVYGGTLPASLFAFKLAKQEYPGIQTVIGGGVFAGELALESPNFRSFLQAGPYIDKIIAGEGELLFLKCLQDELPGPPSKRVYSIKDIKQELLNISTVATPDFSDFDISLYPHLATYTSRSCPFQCNFCVETVYWGKYRKKSGKQMVNELKELQQTHGYQFFVLCDSLLNPVIRDLSHELLKTDLSLYWDGYIRVDPYVCDPEHTLRWRQAGFYRARLGLESGSQKVLDTMGKKISIEQIKTAVSTLAGAGIKTTTMWIVGYPGETEADFQKTLELVEELSDDIYEADLNPFWYFLNGQVNSESWAKQNKSILLYPEWAADMLIAQTWILEGEPSREKIYERVNRFVEHCKHLGVPNPYTLPEIYEADKRWKQLHRNAVPSLTDLQGSHTLIDENKQVEKLQLAKNPLQQDDAFEF